MTTSPVSSESFSNAMARVCTPVSVVTTSDGHPHGTTVSAFTSLSLTPPMVLVSLDRRSDLLAQLTRTRRFGLNVLSAAQAGVATRFAKKGPDTFDGITWYDESGCPRLDGVLAWLACAVAEVLDGGDHRIVLGNVLRVAVRHDEPLTYHARAFGTHLPAAQRPAG